MRKKREAEVLGEIRAYLEAVGCRVFRRTVLGPVQLKSGRWCSVESSGMADLWGVLPDGRHFELEVKRPGEWPRDDQIFWLIGMNGSGENRSVAFWADNLPTTKKVIECVLSGGRVLFVLDSSSRFGSYDIKF